jgi:hypothetical protein
MVHIILYYGLYHSCFKSLNLYFQTRKLPLHPGSGSTNKQVSNSCAITISMFLPPEQFTTLRVILSLVDDIYNSLKILKENNHLVELSPFINELFEHADKFRRVRNFFMHLDEVLTDMDKHGVNWPAKTRCYSIYRSCKGMYPFSMG